MSGTANNFTSPPGNWWPGQGYGAHGLYPNERNRVHLMLPRTSNQRIPYTRGGLQETRLPIEAGPRAVAWLPDPPPSPRDLVGPNRPRQLIPESPPRFMEPRWNMQEQIQVESKLTLEEQKKALKKLKKEIYNPTPKRIAKRLSLYYRDNIDTRNSFNKENEEDEDSKKCAICLEDFEPKEPVMLTPCLHMFHEECIVPWVKSHGQCPVCRFAICERMRGHTVPMNNNTAASDLFVTEVMSIIRAMDGAFEWGRTYH